MAVKETIKGFTTWTINAVDGVTRATFVPELGAIGSSLVLPAPDGPRETLFQHDHFWDPDTDQTRGGSPFLFPICGRLERGGQPEIYLYDAQRYTMKIHGFAHQMSWQVVAHDDPAELAMELSDTEETRKQYPFAFTVRLTFRVEPGVLVCEQQYHNRGDRPLPYYAGFHPYLLTPPPEGGKSGVRVAVSPQRVLAYNPQLTDIVGVKPETPDFPAAITDPAINEQLLQMGKDKKASLLFPDGFEIHLCADSETDADRFPYVQLYTMPDKPFFCIEPWMSFPNALNTVSGVRWLAPRQTDTARFQVATQC